MMIPDRFSARVRGAALLSLPLASCLTASGGADFGLGIESCLRDDQVDVYLQLCARVMALEQRRSERRRPRPARGAMGAQRTCARASGRGLVATGSPW